MTQHERDLAALHQRGFSHLSAAQQQRLLANGDAPKTTAPARDPIAHLVVGTLVRFTTLRNPPAWVKQGDLGVVIVDKGERVNVAPLGGFEDRYLRVPRRALTVVNPADVINTKPS